MPDSRLQRKEIPFSGKFYTMEPAAIGTNFQTLKNLRYTDTHVKDVKGMTKVNEAVMNATYHHPRNAFHFKKSQPAESHLLVHAYTNALTTAAVVEHTAAIPATGAFSATVLITATGTALGRFSDAPDGQMIYCNGVDNCMWGGTETKLGALVLTMTVLTSAPSAAVSPQIYTDQVNNTKVDSANYFSLTPAGYKTVLVGCTRPAQGATFTFANVNTTANTLEVTHSTATVWTTLSTSDGTRTGGTTSFAQNGKITWTLPATKLKYIEGYYLYWYQFALSDGTANISHITLDIPFQPIVDIWDGIYRDVAKFYTYTTTQTDKTVNVYRDDYDETSTLSFVDISSLTSAGQYLEAGFSEKMTGLYLAVPSGYENGSATVASIDYWTGAAYTTVGDISDGTSTGGASLAKSGVISWNNTALASEHKKQYNNSVPLYFYRLKFTENLDAAVRLNYVAGISASKEISHFKFPVFAQGRVLLCADMSSEKNKAVVSSKYMPQVYNGIDSVDVYFGDEGELTCGTELFSQFGSSLYSLVLMFKDNETWVMAGQDIEQWENNTFLLSSSIGCPAPLTLKTINLHAEPGTGINRALAIWQGANGIYMSDGRAPIPISNDIREYFDPSDSRCIFASKIGDSVGFVDPVKEEYHWLFYSGVQESLTELVYDIARNKWFEINRGSYPLICGVTVHDTSGNGYAYGFPDNGYMERLENGTTFDGGTITHTIQFGDIPLGGLAVETRVSDVRLITVGATSGDVTLTHYGDTYSTGTDKTMSKIRTGYRVAQPKFQDKLNGDSFHSFKLVATAGFEPLALVATFHPVHQD